MTMPSQNAEKFPATRPLRTLRDAPPSLLASTISRDVAAVYAGEDFDQFGDERAGGGAAGDDRGEFPPELALAEVGDQQVGEDVGRGDGDGAGEEDEHGEGMLEIHFIGVEIFGAGDGLVDEIRNSAGEKHDQAHGEDPDEKGGLDVLNAHGFAERLGVRGIEAGEKDEGDEGDAGDAVGFEAVGGGSATVAGVVAGAVGDDAGVAGVVFLDVEDDLHEVSADVGDFGEDSTGDAQGGGAEGFTDGEADEAGAGQVAGDEQEDEEHHDQLDADQDHADAHAGLQGNGIAGVGLAAERTHGGAAVGEGVDSDAEPGDRDAADNSDQAEQENDGDVQRRYVIAGVILGEDAEVDDEDRADENFKDEDEFDLGFEIGFAGEVDGLRDLAHGAVDGEIFHAAVDDQAEEEAKSADGHAPGEEGLAADGVSEEFCGVEVGNVKTDFAGAGVRGGEQ